MNCKEAIEKKLCSANCCGVIPIPVATYLAFKGICNVDYKEHLCDEFALPVTKDLRCIFLDRCLFNCLIYEQRPKICRLYGLIPELRCPVFDLEGNLLPRVQRRYLRRDIDKQIRRDIRALTRAVDTNILVRSMYGEDDHG